MRCGFINGIIDGRSETAFLIDEGKFIKFGNDSEIRRIVGNDELIDMDGAKVYPGKIDMNAHIIACGQYLSELDLRGIDDKNTLLDKIRRYYHLNGDNVLLGFGLEVDLDKNDLKEFDKGIILEKKSGNEWLLNDTLLDKLNIDNETLIDGGSIDYNKGLLSGNALFLLEDYLCINNNLLEDYIKRGSRYLAKYGITTVVSDDLLKAKDYNRVLNVYDRLAYQDELEVNVVEACRFRTVNEFVKFLDEGNTTFSGDKNFHIGPLKIRVSNDEDEVNTYVQLANRFNMPSILECHTEDEIDLAIKVLNDNVLEGNPLHHGLYNTCFLNDEQLMVVKEKNYLYFEDDALKGSNLPYDCFGVDGNDARVLFMDKMIGKLDENFDADFYLMKENEIIKTVKDGKVVYSL